MVNDIVSRKLEREKKHVSSCKCYSNILEPTSYFIFAIDIECSFWWSDYAWKSEIGRKINIY